MNKCERSRSITRFPVWRVLGVTLLLLGATIRSASAESQQQRGVTITGTVTDEFDEPVTGANVTVKGTTNGNITDNDGKFTLHNVSENASLVISYIGYEKQEVRVTAGNTVYSIRLREDTQALDEVIVVGYGQQKKVSVTGAIATVSPRELRKTTTTRLDNALAGRVTGLTSMQSGGGQPGADGATMYLRGAATVNGKNPLVLVDGVERDNIRTIDMNEVENLSVLKDASATAVYGVRGANGVILITTRRGAKGKPELSISFDESWTYFAKEPSHIDSWDWMELRNQAKKNSEQPIEFSDYVIEKYQNPLQGLNPADSNYETEKRKRLYMYANNDYYRMYIARYTPQARLNANISGGTDFVNYFVNIGYIDQGGNLKTESGNKLGYDPSSWMKRVSLRSNLDFQLAKNFKASVNIASYAEKINMPAVSILYNGDRNWMMTDLIYQALTIKPLSPGPTTISEFGVADGYLVDYKYLDRSAFEVMNRRGFNQQNRKNLNTQFALDWDLSEQITPGLNVKGMVAYDTYNHNGLEGVKKEISYVTNIDYDTDELTYELFNSDASEISLSRSRSSRYRVNFQGSINYARTFRQVHEVTGMVLAQRDYWESEGAEIPYNVIGISARATYAYDDRYLLEANIGYNGSEQFAPNKRFGFFPAFSVGYIVSNEEFLKENQVLTWLKFRGSWGKVGSDKIGGTRFLFQDNIVVGGGTSAGGLGNTISEGLLGNKEITWELSKKFNVAVEFGLFKDFRFSVDYFTDNRSQILISRQTIPQFQGVLSNNIPKVNMGKVDNYGYEFELSYNKHIMKDLSVSVKGNFGFNKNKVINNDEPMRTEDYVYRKRQEGHSLGQLWGYKIDWNSPGKGYFLSKEEINSHESYDFGTPRVGDFVYIDQNGDGVINDKDQVPIGYSGAVPGIVYGITLGGEYKGFDFSVLFSGNGRYSKFFNGQGVYETTMEGTYYDWHRNAWTEERWLNGDKITYPALGYQQGTSHVANDFFIQNRSFLRMKNVEIGYTLPKNALKFMGVTSLRVYVGGQNLLLWDKLRATHIDPEQDNSYGYPITRNFSVGCNINF
jgi:TonB-linked SusC/RagA family outer membrane protein